MRRILPYIMLLALACSCATARYAAGPKTDEILAISGYDGIIEAVTYPCSEPDLTERRMVVYLPASYYEDTLRRYPVMYLLHGARGNEITWHEYGDAFHRLDSLRRLGLAGDFILVQPDLNNYRDDRDYKDGRPVPAVRAFWLLDGEAETYFHKDILERVDSLYRTVPGKEGRAIAGMSSGALQALYLSASHPDTFDYVGLFSPYTRTTFAAWGNKEVYGNLWRRLDAQFRTPPAMFAIYIGKTDIFYPHIKAFERRLSRKGYPHRFVTAEGGHEWCNWTDFLEDFYRTAFK